MNKKFKLNKNRKIIIGLITIVVLGGGMYGYSSYKFQSDLQKQEQSLLDIYQVSGKEKIFMNGKVFPSNSKDLVVSEEQGELDTIKVSDEQLVQKGDILFTCKNSEKLKEVADLNKELEIKKKEKQTAEDDESKKAIDTEIKQLNNQIAVVNKGVYQSVYAPFSGKVYLNTSSKSKESGESVMTLESTDFYVMAQANERDSYKISKDQYVELTAVATNEKYQGIVVKIGDRPVGNSSEDPSSVSDVQITNYGVKISLNSQENLKNGLNMQIVALHGSDYKKVPTSAIVNEGSKNYVYKIVDGVAKKTEIVKGEVQKDFTLVKSGVKENDSIIKDTTNLNIKDGDTISSNTSELDI